LQRELLVAKMQEMQKTLDILDYKIRVYKETILNLERAL